ncbi:hypothetical protein Bca52824_032406 [Brassica carinata]|uniref:Uncharacterized protein n=1 Tax=Brassica carinata TaxID=52824 RepID=A0A8X7SC09_BRACI|nr:hypothetical protein Bca52824_032406 [Brassica carinata]
MEKSSVAIFLISYTTRNRSISILCCIDDTQPLPFDSHNDNKFDYEYLTPDEFAIFRDPKGNARAMDGRILQVSKEDIADILAMANGPDNLFLKQHDDPSIRK